MERYVERASYPLGMPLAVYQTIYFSYQLRLFLYIFALHCYYYDSHHLQTQTKQSLAAHQMAEDYIDLASNLMLYPTAQLGPYGYAAPSGNGINGSSSHYPLDTISALGYLKGSFRRPLVIETWAPYEIAVFEASLGHYGKDFHRVQKEIATKSCQEVVDFYYIWKKTSHYVRWKKQYVPPHLDVSDDELSVK
jgi:hypothetical protein